MLFRPGRSSPLEVVHATAERLIDSTDPPTHLAGRTAFLEPYDFKKKRSGECSTTIWSFGQYHSTHNYLFERQLTRVLRIGKKSGQLAMSVTFIEGSTSSELYVGRLELSEDDETARYTDGLLNNTVLSRADDITRAAMFVTDVELGMMTTEPLARQIKASIIAT